MTYMYSFCPASFHTAYTFINALYPSVAQPPSHQTALAVCLSASGSHGGCGQTFWPHGSCHEAMPTFSVAVQRTGISWGYHI